MVTEILQMTKAGYLPDYCLPRHTALEQRVQQEVDSELQLFWNAERHLYEFWYQGKHTGRWWCALTIPRSKFIYTAWIIEELKRTDLQSRDVDQFMDALDKQNDEIKKLDEEVLEKECYDKRQAVVKEVEKGVFDRDGIDRYYYPKGNKPVHSEIGAKSHENSSRLLR